MISIVEIALKHLLKHNQTYLKQSRFCEYTIKLCEMVGIIFQLNLHQTSDFFENLLCCNASGAVHLIGNLVVVPES